MMKPILSIQVTQQETGNGKLFVQRDICYRSDDAVPMQRFDASVGTPEHHFNHQQSQLKFIDTKILRKLALPIKEFNPLSAMEVAANTQKKPEQQRPDPYIRCFQAQSTRLKQQAPLTVMKNMGENESMSAKGSRKGKLPPPVLFDVASGGGLQGVSRNRPRRSLTAEQQKLVQKHIKRVQS